MSDRKFESLFVPVLQALENGEETRISRIRQIVATSENISEEELQETYEDSGLNKFEKRIAFAVSYLLHAHYLERVERGKYCITGAGAKVLSKSPLKIDLDDLKQSPGFTDWLNRSRTGGRNNQKSQSGVTYEITENFTNNLVSFLRHYGPISSSDNMYDELIRDQILELGIAPEIHIKPEYLEAIESNFQSRQPRSVILTGTAGDGKTYYCRKVFESLTDGTEKFGAGQKFVQLNLPKSSKQLTIVKDLSELNPSDKLELFSNIESSVTDEFSHSVFLMAANDGQLISSWRDWVERNSIPDYHSLSDKLSAIFKDIENFLVNESQHERISHFDLYNLSTLDASKNFENLVEQVVNHPQWSECANCCLNFNEDSKTDCPILINRDRLRNSVEISIFRERLSELMQLARANKMHIPIRDLLLLIVNILLGDQKSPKNLMDCEIARNRAKNKEYLYTNPYGNVFGVNLRDRERQQYQVFAVLEAFGIGRETDNKFDNLLIYGPYDESNLSTQFKELVANDKFYGKSAYEASLREYLEGDRRNVKALMKALSYQRQRLFFTLPKEKRTEFDQWKLTVFQFSGRFLEFLNKLSMEEDISKISNALVRGLNRTFSGMMIDGGMELFLTSSGGDGRGTIAPLLITVIKTAESKREPYLKFYLSSDNSSPMLKIFDPLNGEKELDSMRLKLTHFEFLMRVATGSLPSSFSRQCNEDLLDFKLRLINGLSDESTDTYRVDIESIKVDENGRPQNGNIHINLPTYE